jgi:phosphoglycerate dehydrogenase-like enzyme
MDILIIGYERLTKEIIKNTPKLKLVVSERDGPEENIDIEACTEAGIPVLHSCGRCINPVGEHTFTMMLALARQFVTEVQMVREGYWNPDDKEKMSKLMAIVDFGVDELHGATLGIVGLGRNGLNIAQRGVAFGMNVIGYDPFANKEFIESQGIKMVSLEEIMKESDYFVIMARVSEDTIGMIGRKEIEMMKPTARFINTARAQLVDYDALYEAVKNGKIAGVALDVFDEEPLSVDSRWFKLDPAKVILTPHQAGISRQRDNSHSIEITKYIEQYLRGEMPDSLMDKKVFDVSEFKERGELLFGIEKQKKTL